MSNAYNRLSIDEVFAAISFPVEEKALWYKAPDGSVKQCSHKAIIRSDNGNECGTVHKDYGLVPHKEALETALATLHEKKYVFRQAAISDASIFIEACAPNDPIHVRRADGRTEEHIPRIILKNSYNRSSSIITELGLYRMICTNGMIIPSFKGSKTRLAVRHTRNASESLKEWRKFFENNSWIDQAKGTLEGLDVAISQEKVISVLSTYFKAENKEYHQLQEDERFKDVIRRAMYGQGQYTHADRVLTKYDVFQGITERIRDGLQPDAKPSTLDNANQRTLEAMKLLIAA